jgi:phytol kinase
MDTSFFIHQIVLVALLLGIYYATGKLVLHTGIKVNYTRKIDHFAIFFLPFLLDMLFVYQKSILTRVLGLVVSICSLGIFIKPIRERSKTISTMFLSFDRPEDRPRTLLWLTTQYIGAAFVIVPLMMCLDFLHKPELVFIPILINGLGDGLAEPIGVRFGRMKYSVRALFSDERYVRSFEGSLCVFVAGVLSVIAFRNSFAPAQFMAALALIPLGTTLAEAFSPHTWDTPFIYGTAGVLLIGILSFL